MRPDAVVHRAGVLGADDCTRWTRATYAARADWTPCFEGVQFTLGRAYYTHLEEEREAEYFDDAAASDARVERALPGMQAEVRALLAAELAAAVVARGGWCGPGVHVFPAGGWLAAHGGDVHFDTEGLPATARAARAPAVSAILMLQPPSCGGGLRVWEAHYAGEDEVDGADSLPSTVVDYAPGDLLIIDSYRLHQIQPFSGARDRISITAHAVLAGGRWQAWF